MGSVEPRASIALGQSSAETVRIRRRASGERVDQARRFGLLPGVPAAVRVRRDIRASNLRTVMELVAVAWWNNTPGNVPKRTQVAAPRLRIIGRPSFAHYPLLCGTHPTLIRGRAAREARSRAGAPHGGTGRAPTPMRWRLPNETEAITHRIPTTVMAATGLSVSILAGSLTAPATATARTETPERRPRRSGIGAIRCPP